MRLPERAGLGLRAGNKKSPQAGACGLLWDGVLVEDLGNDAGTNGTPTFTNGELGPLFDRDRTDHVDFEGDVITRHNHFNAFWQLDYTGNVRCVEVELRAVVREEWRVTATFFLAQDINFTLELGVGLDGTWLCQDLATFDLFATNATKQDPNVIASFTQVEGLTEHFKPSNGGLEHFFLQTNDLDFVTNLDRPTVDTARSNGPTAGDGEDVFDRHQEWLVGVTNWGRDVFVDRIHEFFNHLALFWVAFKGLEGGTTKDRNVVTREIVFGQKFTNFHFHKVGQFFVVDKIGLVQEDDQVVNAHLASQQDVFTRLWHRAVSSGNNQDRTIHLSSTGDHVLNVVRVPWRIDVSVVALFGLVFNVSGVDGDTTFLFFRSSIDGCIVLRLGETLFRKYGSDCRGQGSLTVVNVPDRTNVDVGLSAFIVFFFSHEKTNLLYIFVKTQSQDPAILYVLVYYI